MVKKEVLDKYFELLKPELKSYGFTPKKGDRCFIKKTETGFNEITIVMVVYPNLAKYKVTFLFRIRVDAIQYLMNHPLKVVPAYHEKSVTTTTNIKHLANREEEHDVIKSVEDIEKSVANFLTVFKSAGIEHFDTFSSLENLHGLYFESLEELKKHFGIFQWVLYVPTISYLYNRENFPGFMKEFYPYLEENGINEANIQRVRSYIEEFLR